MLGLFLRRYAYGILPRYIGGQVLKSFAMALVTLTGVIVLFMVMAEATRQGLAPQDILRVVPFIIPSSLPYTVPVALLFAVSVVYGRMASDNEILAIKAAGLSAVKALTPAWALGLLLSGGLYYASSDAIPRATHGFRKIIFQDFEDMLYKVLKKEGKFDSPGLPFYIGVKDVKDRTLIGATFKHRKSKEDRKGPDDQTIFDLQVYAEKAWINYDLAAGLVRVVMERAETNDETSKFVMMINGKQTLEYPLPKDQKYKLEKRVQEMTNAELTEQQAIVQRKIEQEQARQAVAAAMWMASGRIERVAWPAVGEAYKDFPYWTKKIDEYETEKNLRAALAAGTVLFVWIGAPVGILFARRDFLSAFISCFLPIIVLYYPLTLAGVNLAKEGAAFRQVVFAGNALLAIVGTLVVWRVQRH